ncbi:MAG: esterase/lipase family protein [Patescibacteria group bacterium]|jgi:pimeloyl-ACP methyl ester carboxylesterase
MGSGISIGYTGTSSNYPFYQFSLWRDADRGSHFLYNDFHVAPYGCTNFAPYQDLASRKYNSLPELGSEWHILKIVKEGSKYSFYLDGSNLIYVTDDNQCVPPVLFLGNPLSGGQSDWNELLIDYIRINNNQGPESERKIVLIPGLGASWNEKAMVFGQEVDDEDWRMTPFVSNCRDIARAFEEKGLIINEDYFVWNYDWRKPVEEILINFDGFVENNFEDEDTIDLVGHSLGGLVARSWYQDSNRTNLGRVISIGSPNSGAIKAYEAWSGGRVSDRTNFSSVALNILLQLQKKNFESNVETIRWYAPVIKDLLPVFNFLRNNEGLVDFESQTYRNDFLITQNSNVSEIYPNFDAIVARGIPTVEWINVEPAGIFDRILGYWDDGKPVFYERTSEGDGTVLVKSAKFPDDNYIEIESNHGDMVGGAIDEVFEILGLGSFEGIVQENKYEDNLYFYMGSPADIEVRCGQDFFEDTDGFIVVNETTSDSCEVVLTGISTGVYHLVTGSTYEGGVWNYFENEIKENEEVEFVVDAVSGRLIDDNINSEFLFNLIKRDLNLLKENYGDASGLDLAFNGVRKRDLEKIVRGVFVFRKNYEERIVTKRVLENVLRVAESGSVNIAKKEALSVYEKMTRDEKFVDRTVYSMSKKGQLPSRFQSLAYKDYEELRVEADKYFGSKNWPSLFATSITVDFLIDEVRR